MNIKDLIYISLFTAIYAVLRPFLPICLPFLIVLISSLVFLIGDVIKVLIASFIALTIKTSFPLTKISY